MRQQIANGDRALRRHGRPAGRDRRLRELRNHTADRVGDRELAFLDERQDGGTGDGFRLRGDSEDGVRGHPPPGFLVAPPDGPLVHRLTVAQHEGDDAGDAVVIDVSLQRAVDSGHAFGRELYLRRDGRAGCGVLRGQRGRGHADRGNDQPVDETLPSHRSLLVEPNSADSTVWHRRRGYPGATMGAS